MAKIYIYSNDGSALLYEGGADESVTLPAFIHITENGVALFASGATAPIWEYTYDGEKAFEGVATAANAGTATEEVGEIWTFDGTQDIIWYIVESDGEESVSVDLGTCFGVLQVFYNGKAIVDVDKSFTKVTLACKGAKLLGDIVVVAPKVDEPDEPVDPDEPDVPVEPDEPDEPDVPDEKIVPPTITLKNGIISITDNDERVTYYELYANLAAKATTTEKTIDLSTLSFTNGVSYDIFVKTWFVYGNGTKKSSAASNHVTYTPKEETKLTAPAIRLVGDTLVIIPADVSYVDSYVILVDGKEMDELSYETRVEYDLTTFNLSAGTHEITVISTGTGYANSDPSNSVYYDTEWRSKGEVYVLDGWWDFNDELLTNAGWLTQANFEQSIAFKAGGVAYSKIKYNNGKLYYDDTLVYDNTSINGWTDDQYKEIRLEYKQNAYKVFCDFLVRNALKYGNFWFSAEGFVGGGIRYYQSDGIMTWEQWCESIYNVDGFYCKNGYVYSPDLPDNFPLQWYGYPVSIYEVVEEEDEYRFEKYPKE